MRDLTSRQKMILDFIAQSVERHGCPPTIREIADAMGIRSPNGVNDHLKALERKGCIERRDLKSRGIRLLPAATKRKRKSADDADSLRVPLYGAVAGGAPIQAEENLERELVLDASLFGRLTDLFALRVEGDSMIEAGIRDGDLIFVRRQSTAQAGDIVVALIDGDATVKRFQPYPDRAELVPANAAMRPIVVYPEDGRRFDIVGRVVYALKAF